MTGGHAVILLTLCTAVRPYIRVFCEYIAAVTILRYLSVKILAALLVLELGHSVFLAVGDYAYVEGEGLYHGVRLRGFLGKDLPIILFSARSVLVRTAMRDLHNGINAVLLM